MKMLKLLVAAVAAVAMTFAANAAKTAKAVLTDEGKTLKFVYDTADYGTKGTHWFSVAEAEALEPGYNPPWWDLRGTVTKVLFDGSFAGYQPGHCAWFLSFAKLATVEGLENLDVSEATSLTMMFGLCESLTSLDLSGFNTAKVTDMSSMFQGCKKLEQILVSDAFTTAAVTASGYMFYNCTALKGGAGTAYDSTKIDKTYARIDGKEGQPGYFTEKTAKVVVEDGGKTLRFVYDGTNYGVEGVDWLAVGPDETEPGWADLAATVKKVIFDASFRNFRPLSCQDWFSGFTQLNTLEGLSNLDLSETTDIGSMFEGCLALTAIDLSSHNMAKANGSYWTFHGCSALRTVLLPDTLPVIGEGMFENCSALEAIAIPSGVRQIKDFAFSGCTKLASVQFAEGLQSICGEVFESCSQLRSLALPSTVKTLGILPFEFCANLADLQVSAANPYFASVDGVIYDKAKTKLVMFPPGRTGSFAVPAGVKTLGAAAFSATRIESVRLSADVSSAGIEWSADGPVTPFLMSGNLKSITVDARNSVYSSVDGVLYDKSRTTLICCPGGRSGVLRIPSGVTAIDHLACCLCPLLESVAIPKSVNSIGLMAFIPSYDLDDPDALPPVFYVEPGDKERVAQLLITAVADISKVTIIEGEPPVSPPSGDALFDSLVPGERNPKGATYNGFLGDETLGGTFTLKVMKPKKGSTTASATLTKVDPAIGKKVKVTGTVDVNTGLGAGDLAGLELNAQGVGGTLAGVVAQGSADAVKAKDAAALAVMSDLNKKTYGIAIMDTAGDTAYLTVAFSAKGKVKVSGSYRGVTVSGQAQTCVGDCVCVPFVWAKKGLRLSFVLWFNKATRDLFGATGFGSGTTLAALGSAGAPAGTYVLKLGEGDLYASVPEAIAETPLEVAVAFNGKKFDAGKAAKVSCKNGVLAVDTAKGTNVSGLKLKYTKGALKGSFTVYAVTGGKLVKNKFTVAGVVVDGVGYATATSRKLPTIPVLLTR